MSIDRKNCSAARYSYSVAHISYINHVYTNHSYNYNA